MWKPVWEKVNDAPEKPKQYKISLSCSAEEFIQVVYLKRLGSELVISKKVPITEDGYYCKKGDKKFAEEIQKLQIKYKEDRKNKQYQYLLSYIGHIRDEEGLPEYLYTSKKKRGVQSKYSGTKLVDLMKKYNIKQWNNVIIDYQRKPQPMINGYPSFKHSKYEEFKDAAFNEYRAQNGVLYIDKYVASKKGLWNDIIKYCESKDFLNYKNIEDLYLILILLLFNELINNKVSLDIECNEHLALLMRSVLTNYISDILFLTEAQRIATELLNNGSIKKDYDFELEKFVDMILGELESYICHELVNKNIKISRDNNFEDIIVKISNKFEKNVFAILKDIYLINESIDSKNSRDSFEINYKVYELRKKYRDILMNEYKIEDETIDNYQMYRLSYETINKAFGKYLYEFSKLDISYPINIIHMVDENGNLIKRYLQIYPFMRDQGLFSGIITLLNFHSEEKQDDYNPEIIKAEDLISQDDILFDNLLYGSLLFELPLVYVPSQIIREKYTYICAARERVYPKVTNTRKRRNGATSDGIKYAAQNYRKSSSHLALQETLEELHTIYYDYDNFQHRNNRKKKYRL